MAAGALIFGVAVVFAVGLAIGWIFGFAHGLADDDDGEDELWTEGFWG